MTDQKDALPAYVRAALELQGYAFSDERVSEITAQFARIAAIAQTLQPAVVGLGPAGPAPVFRP